jgi:6-phosphofructokinase 1
MRIGLLTGGGDCAGLNAAIRAVVRSGSSFGDEFVGFHHGWRGVVEDESSTLTTADTRGILPNGGTILRTAGFHPHEHEGGVAAVVQTVERHRLDALIVIGGDGTLGSANHLAELGVPIVGIAKTIDNDVQGTTHCIGFDTAVATAVEAIDRLQTTGESHDRLMIVEVMGRTVGWLAVCSALAGGADALCLPELPTDFDELAKAVTRFSRWLGRVEGLARTRATHRLRDTTHRARSCATRWFAHGDGPTSRHSVRGERRRSGSRPPVCHVGLDL